MGRRRSRVGTGTPVTSPMSVWDDPVSLQGPRSVVGVRARSGLSDEVVLEPYFTTEYVWCGSI